MVDLSALGAEASGWLGAKDSTVQRMAELAAAQPAPQPVQEAAEPAAPAELAFDAINEAMAQDFARDQTPIVAALPVGPEAAPVAPEATPEIVAVIVTDPCLNPEIESMTLALLTPIADAPNEEVEIEDIAVDDAAARLNSAVRLTREAVQAWASVIQSAGDDATPTR